MIGHGESSHRKGAKGRIAQVLASARASLKEPSRPVTPAGLDSKVSVLNLLSIPCPISVSQAQRNGKKVTEIYDLSRGERLLKY